MSYFTTIKFLLAVLKKKAPIQPDIEKNIVLSDGSEFSIDIYEPVNQRKCRGTILFVHGMNKLGNRDSRMMALSRAAALCNYRAIAPTFKLIAQHIADMKSITHCVELIKLFAADKSLCEQGKLAIFTASLSGSISVRAITEGSTASLVTSLCSVGICFHPIPTFTHLMGANLIDHYSKYVSIKVLLYAANELTPEMGRALDLAIDKEFEHTDEQALQQFLAQASEITRKQMQQFIEMVSHQQDMTQLFKYPIEMINQQFEVKDLDKLQCCVTLIHSADDIVLPTVESELLYQALKKHHKPVRLLITPLLDHADVQFSFKYVLAGIRLINAFHYFFKHI